MMKILGGTEMLTVNEFAKKLDLAYMAQNLQKKDIIET